MSEAVRFIKRLLTHEEYVRSRDDFVLKHEGVYGEVPIIMHESCYSLGGEAVAVKECLEDGLLTVEFRDGKTVETYINRLYYQLSESTIAMLSQKGNTTGSEK